jgi:hypothetical protein
VIEFKIQPQRQQGPLLVLGKGDPAGCCEIGVMLGASRGGTVIVPWGYDYGFGFDMVLEQVAGVGRIHIYV